MMMVDASASLLPADDGVTPPTFQEERSRADMRSWREEKASCFSAAIVVVVGGGNSNSHHRSSI